MPVVEMNIAFVGCGYVASFYWDTLRNHPQLQLVGAMDAIQERADVFCRHCNIHRYDSLDQILDDDNVDAIINLTNPDSHYEISAAALESGKHVYTEKPLATDLFQAAELVRMAQNRNLQLSSAPCNVLSESAQTLWRSLRQRQIGQVRLVYAEMDDGMIHQLPYQDWVSEIGCPWPYKDEFEVGCTLEHAGYYVTWLVAFFGSVTKLTTLPLCLVPDKKTTETIDSMAADFSVACLEFESGVVARLTCSIVAEHDHALRVFGDEGTLSIEDCWYYDSPVFYEPFSNLSSRMKKVPFLARVKGAHRRKLPLAPGPGIPHCYGTGGHRMDFCRGIADMADAVREGRDCRLSAEFSLHINEVVLKIQNPSDAQSTQIMETRTAPMLPMAWAQGVDHARLRDTFDQTLESAVAVSKTAAM